MSKAVAGLVVVFSVAMMLWVQIGSEASKEGASNPTASHAQRDQVDEGRSPGQHITPSRDHCRFDPGERFAYEGTTQTSVDMDLSPLIAMMNVSDSALTLQASAAQHRETLRTWSLELEAVERRPDHSNILAAQLHSVKATLINGEHTGDMHDISAPFLIHVSEHCGILEFAWRHDAPKQGTISQQTLVAALNFWLPKPSDSARFEANAFDFTGRYLAVYHSRGDRIGGRLEKYDRVFADARGGDRGTHVKDSSIMIALGERGWFDTLKTSRTIAFDIRDVHIGELTSTTETRHAEPNDWRAEVDPRDSGWIWGLILEQKNIDVEQTYAIPDHVKGLETEDALAILRKMLDRQGKNPAEYGPFLRDWMRAHPELIPDITAMIFAGDFHDEAVLRSVIFFALGAANTPETRAALMTMFQSDELAEGYRIGAARSLAGTHPLPEGFIDSLIGDINDPEGNALGRGSMALNLGRTARAQETQNPAAAQAARNEIRDMLATSEGGDHLVYSLQSAGNAGHDELITAIEPYLDHEDGHVRGIAARSLRGMSEDVAMDLVTSHYQDETSSSVRMQLLESAWTMSSNSGAPPAKALVSLVIEQLPATETGREFKGAVALLGQASEQGDKEARAALERALREEMASDERDHKRLRYLGKHTNSQWTRD